MGYDTVLRVYLRFWGLGFHLFGFLSTGR